MAAYRQMSAILFVLAAFLSASSYVEGTGVLFSSLPKALLVKATLPDGGPITEVQTGQDSIVVSWSTNTTVAPFTASKVRTKLCFAKESQTLRGWRKTNDDLKKDKTCLYDVALVEYTPTGGSATYKFKKSIPGAKYFVRAYAIDATGRQVAFGQTSLDKVANTFTVIPITGRHTSIDVAVGVFSVFSVGSLFLFFVMENIYLKRKKSV